MHRNKATAIENNLKNILAAANKIGSDVKIPKKAKTAQGAFNQATFTQLHSVASAANQPNYPIVTTQPLDTEGMSQ